MTEKILIVDDEILLLNSLKRELNLQYTVETADSGAEGLTKIMSDGPYAVIVSDFRMPKMDGIKFLTQAMEIAPDSVRIMLTGNADLPTAIEAINTGHIFRFLSKPCSGKQLTQSLDAALRQYQLVMAEKELLEKTLKETISLLVEVLALVNPKAYGRSLRIQRMVSHLIEELKLNNGWQYETAAALSQLGWIIFTPEMLDKIEVGLPFDASEAILYSYHPYTTNKLLRNIPRLEAVTRMIIGQDRSIDDLCLDPAIPEAYEVDLGSHILKVCIDYDQLTLEGLQHNDVLQRLQAKKNFYLPMVLDALANFGSHQPGAGKAIEKILLDELEDGMFVVEPVMDLNGRTLVKANTIITRSILIKLLSMKDKAGAILEPILIVRRSSQKS